MKQPRKNKPILDRIVQSKLNRLEIQKQQLSVKNLLALLDYQSTQVVKQAPFKFSDRIRNDSLLDDQMAIIAEVKRASPSKGLICKDFDPTLIGLNYELNGASAISILTEEDYFLGHPDFLFNLSKEVHIPTLRKDFIVDPYQIYESVLLRANAILLIVRILRKETLKEFINLSHSLGLEALVEVHTAEEIEVAVDAGAKIIGVNNRDLKTFKVSLEKSIELKPYIPKSILAISESGIKNRTDILTLKEAGFSAALVGEQLMREPQGLQKLRGQ